MRRVLPICLGAMLASASLPVLAEEATKADPQHYSLEFENEHVSTGPARNRSGTSTLGTSW